MKPSEIIEPKAFTEKYNRSYTQLAHIYDWFAKTLLFYRRWITSVNPHIEGPNVLEVSFGTGFLLCTYADRFNSFGIDYNWKLSCIARENLLKSGKKAAIQQADVYHLPYPAKTFDTVVNTMAFSGYPDGLKALLEIHRVLKPGGRFLLVDVGYPVKENWLGTQAARFWVLLGDFLHDMGDLFRQVGFIYTTEEIGGFGSVQLYLAEKVAKKQGTTPIT